MRVRLVLVLLLLLAPYACRKAPDKDVRVLHVAMREVSSADPAFINSSNDFQVAANLHAALFTWDADKSRAKPDLVSRFEADEKHLTWTFVLRQDIKFSDGTPITAGDFEFAWKRILTPATASPGADALYFIKGARSFTAGKGGQPSVTAVDERTLRIELESPQPFLPAILASPRFAPVPAGLSEAHTDIYRDGRLVSSGPYVLDSWTNRQAMVLKANSHYHGQHGHFETVELHFTASEETALKWWDTGKVDLVSGLVPFARIRFLKEEHGDQLVSQPMRSVFYFMANLARSPSNLVELRRAVFNGLDRESLVLEVLGAGQEAAYGFIPDRYRNSIGFTPRPCPRKGVQEAAAELPTEVAQKAAGTELMCNSSETLKNILQHAQQTVKKRVGLHLAIRMMEWKSFLAMLKKGDFTLARMSLTGGADPVDFLDNFTRDSSNNFSRFESPEFEALILRIHGTGDAAKRFALMHEAHALLCENLPAIPVYFSTQVYLVRRALLPSFAPNDEGIILWHQLGRD